MAWRLVMTFAPGVAGDDFAAGKPECHNRLSGSHHGERPLTYEVKRIE